MFDAFFLFSTFSLDSQICLQTQTFYDPVILLSSEILFCQDYTRIREKKDKNVYFYRLLHTHTNIRF